MGIPGLEFLPVLSTRVSSAHEENLHFNFTGHFLENRERWGLIQKSPFYLIETPDCSIHNGVLAVEAAHVPAIDLHHLPLSRPNELGNDVALNILLVLGGEYFGGCTYDGELVHSRGKRVHLFLGHDDVLRDATVLAGVHTQLLCGEELEEDAHVSLCGKQILLEGWGDGVEEDGYHRVVVAGKDAISSLLEGGRRSPPVPWLYLIVNAENKGRKGVVGGHKHVAHTEHSWRGAIVF